jgi:serine/threonine-protein kinase
MTPERHAQIKRIFLAACDVEPGREAALLDQACAGDMELRKEVESLLLHRISETIIQTPAESKSDQGELFPPGTVLAGRYRILAPLGRGGMGDVYRADDLKLDQPVALKFLSACRSTDSAWLRRYENEVRLARKVTHPNVLRVYDIVETQGYVFITMEYVDGEDLSSLLRRIGRLTSDKAIQIARQLCAGLGAAHDQGVLHRDLKPANIMIDGRGQVRIADFGIAALASQDEPSGPVPGTPAYMAPEFFEGGRPSIRSDLYALGIVLFEVATGKEPFEGQPPTGHDRTTAPARLSVLAPDINPTLDTVILQCLAHDPRQRPASAYAIAAALPGGDPLRLALAAGETPSPSMVAAAGNGGLFPLGAATGCLIVGLLALALVVALADRTFFWPQAGLVKSSEVLADRAVQIINRLGYDPIGKEHAQGFAIDPAYLQRAGQNSQAAYFWYRVGDEQRVLPALLGEPPAAEALPLLPDSLYLRLNGEGQLRELTAPSGGLLADSRDHPMEDWSKIFELAGLNLNDFQSVASGRHPPMYADHLAAWKSRLDARKPCIVARGATLAGRVVFFQVGPTVEEVDICGAAGIRPSLWRTPFRRLVLNLLAVFVACILAWHNLLSGRGDYRGARRLALFIVALGLCDWLLGEKHSAVLSDEVASLYVWIARTILTATIAWLCYFAVEPYVRKFWPQMMITWSRVLEGRFRDPLLGRDILIGGTCGILLLLLLQLDNLLPSWLGLPRPLPRLPNVAWDATALVGLRYKLSVLATVLISSVTLGLIVLVMMLVVRMVVRRPWPTAAISWLGLTIIQATTAGPDTAFAWMTSAVIALVVTALMLRAGLVAVIAASFFLTLLSASPLTSDFRAWYAPSCVFAVAVASLLLCYGFYAARAGRPLLWRRTLNALALFLGIVGFVGCIAPIVGVWIG